VNQSDLRADAGPFLLWLAFKGTVTKDQIEERWCSAPSTPELIKMLLADDLIGEDDDYIFLEDAGDAFLSEISCGALSDSERVQFQAFVETFEPIDHAVKRAVTGWQQRRGVDATLGPDALSAVDDWMDAHTRLQDVVAASAPVVRAILEPYLRGLDAAIVSFEAGDLDAFTGGADDSYHSQWFVMHELILRSVGIRR
jgi:hypothetical protein